MGGPADWNYRYQINHMLSPGGKQKKVSLNSSDELFADLRDLHFVSVGGYLSRRAKNLNVVMDERHMAQSVSQLRVFVAKIPHIQVHHGYTLGRLESQIYMGCFSAHSKYRNDIYVDRIVILLVSIPFHSPYPVVR